MKTITIQKGDVTTEITIIKNSSSRFCDVEIEDNVPMVRIVTNHNGKINSIDLSENGILFLYSMLSKNT